MPEKDIRVPVRDGTRLALDLYLPARDGKPLPGKHPTLLARTPYNKNGSTAEARWFASRGYAVVVNDVRGRYASEGSWRMLVDDPNDGYDLLQWIGSQPWCNGRLMPQHLLHLPIRPDTTPLKHVPEYESWLVEAMRHGDYDAFWKQPGYSVVDNVDRYADVPVYHVTGWYDSWCRQNVLNWQALSKAKKSPQRLIIGPWTHGAQGRNVAGELEFPPNAALAFNDWRVRWFDRWLKDIDNCVARE